MGLARWQATEVAIVTPGSMVRLEPTASWLEGFPYIPMFRAQKFDFVQVLGKLGTGLKTLPSESQLLLGRGVASLPENHCRNLRTR